MILSTAIKLLRVVHGLSRKENPALVKAVLHLGAHRCATTTFQCFLDLNRDTLHRDGISVWTPQDTRAGLFGDLFCPAGANGPGVKESVMRVQTALNGLLEDRLIVSEENMIGSPQDNLDRASLYPDAARRMSRYKAAFGGHLDRLVLTVRPLEVYWSSLLAFAVLRGYRLPDANQCIALAMQQRGWRHVIRDLRRLFPTTQLSVLQFEPFAAKPHLALSEMISSAPGDLCLLLAKKNYSRDTQNLRRLLNDQGRQEAAKQLPAGCKRWDPFSAVQRAQLAAQDAADLKWLRTNSDPYITYHAQAATQVPRRPDIGESYDIERQMGRIGRERAAWQAS